MDFARNVSSNVKLCYSCHGFETAMAFLDLRISDKLNFRVGRFSPALGSFPLRADPANHRTSDKPLMYDMGRMLHKDAWNEGVLPAPWVDNGVEINGTHFLSRGQLDYEVYAISGPKGNADAADFDFLQSRSGERSYIDNNSRLVVGARVGATLDIAGATTTVGASAMTGTYDPQGKLRFVLAGVDAVAQYKGITLRSEYLIRRTQMALGEDPSTRFKYGPGADGRFDNYFIKDGFYVETEVPINRVALIARWDGLRRRGNVLADSELRSSSAVLRYTAAAAIRVAGGLRVKTSVELYDFSDFADELAFHVGVAAPF